MPRSRTCLARLPTSISYTATVSGVMISTPSITSLGALAIISSTSRDSRSLVLPAISENLRTESDLICDNFLRPVLISAISLAILGSLFMCFSTKSRTTLVDSPAPDAIRSTSRTVRRLSVEPYSPCMVLSISSNCLATLVVVDCD